MPGCSLLANIDAAQLFLGLLLRKLVRNETHFNSFKLVLLQFNSDNKWLGFVFQLTKPSLLKRLCTPTLLQ